MEPFGRDNFKADVYEDIVYRQEIYKLNNTQVASDIADVLKWFCMTAFDKDEEIKRIRQEAYDQAKEDLKKDVFSALQ